MQRLLQELNKNREWKDRWDFDSFAKVYDEVVHMPAPQGLPFYEAYDHVLDETAKHAQMHGDVYKRQGVVRAALAKADKSLPMNELADIIKKTAFKVTRMGQLVGTLASERLGVPFGIVDLSLAPTPAIGDSVAYILEEMGLESCGAYGRCV